MPRHGLDPTIDVEPVDKERNVRLVAPNYMNVPLSDPYRMMMMANCCCDRPWAWEAMDMRRDTRHRAMGEPSFFMVTTPDSALIMTKVKCLLSNT